MHEAIIIPLNPIWTELVMILSYSITNYCIVNEGLIIYDFYNLPLPTVCLSWQTAQTQMRRRILRHFIWVYTVCIYSLFECIQPVPHVRTLNFSLAMPLKIILFLSRPRQLPDTVQEDQCSSFTHSISSQPSTIGSTIDYSRIVALYNRRQHMASQRVEKPDHVGLAADARDGYQTS